METWVQRQEKRIGYICVGRVHCDLILCHIQDPSPAWYTVLTAVNQAPHVSGIRRPTFFSFTFAERNRPLNKGGRLPDTLPHEAERWMPSSVLDRCWCNTVNLYRYRCSLLTLCLLSAHVAPTRPCRPRACCHG